MIKLFLINAIFIVLFHIGNAQKNLVEYGFHGGINLNSSHGTSLLNDKAGILVGYNAGTHIKIRITDHFGIKAILQYEQNGWAYRSLTFENSTGTGLAKGIVKYRLNYLTLPLLAEFQAGNRIKFKSNLGVFVGALLKNQLITNIQGTTGYTTTKSSSDNWKSFNYGISFGVGAQLPITSTVKLNFDARDNIGLADLNKLQSSSESTIKTKSISISSGLTFQL